MALETATNIDNSAFVIGGDHLTDFAAVIQQDASRSAVLESLTLMAKERVAVDTPVAGGSNTGDGTVTLFALAAGAAPQIGSYSLEVTNPNQGGVASAGTVTADGSNTGNGTSSTAVPGAAVEEGTYTIKCIEAITDGGRFEVITPSDKTLNDLLVGTAYTNSHLGSLTISDDTTDFAVGDFFTVVITIAHGSRFKLVDPDGKLVKDDIDLPGTAAGTVVFTAAGLTGTITDGATDFALGDSFALPVVAGSGKYIPYSSDKLGGGNEPIGIYMGTDDITAAALVAGDITAQLIMTGGSQVIINPDLLVFDDAGSLTSPVDNRGTVTDVLRTLGIWTNSVTQGNEFID